MTCFCFIWVAYFKALEILKHIWKFTRMRILAKCGAFDGGWVSKQVKLGYNLQGFMDFIYLFFPRSSLLSIFCDMNTIGFQYRLNIYKHTTTCHLSGAVLRAKTQTMLLESYHEPCEKLWSCFFWMSKGDLNRSHLIHACVTNQLTS